MELATLPLTEAADLIQQRKVSPLELVEACLKRIDQSNPTLNAFTYIDADGARKQASALQSELEQGQYRGPLHGLPVAIKDAIDVAGIPTTVGSRLMLKNKAHDDAKIVESLRAAGAIILGKLNMHAWSFGVTNTTSHFGPTRNPWDTTRITGGSSGGAAAAVATGMCFAALGTDTGGSVRIPAALCGVTGLKPTYGRLSMRGVVPLSWSLDHMGVLTRTAQDVAAVMAAVAEYDEADPFSVNAPSHNDIPPINGDLSGYRIAFAFGDYFDKASSDVADLVAHAGNTLKRHGADIGNVTIKHMQDAFDNSRIMLHADAAAYHRDRLASADHDFSDEQITRFEHGQSLSAVDYAVARRKQAVLKQKFRAFFKEYDLIITPTTPLTAVRLDDEDKLQAARILLGRFTAGWNFLGCPALTVPCGLDTHGLPIGMQIIGAAWDESKVLNCGYAYQQITDWHKNEPPC
jgi:aspartyl-tRNA(Asn)/glutamyl-tRNA(Gln) amidotransferase subunit A